MHKMFGIDKFTVSISTIIFKGMFIDSAPLKKLGKNYHVTDIGAGRKMITRDVNFNMIEEYIVPAVQKQFSPTIDRSKSHYKTGENVILSKLRVAMNKDDNFKISKIRKRAYRFYWKKIEDLRQEMMDDINTVFPLSSSKEVQNVVQRIKEVDFIDCKISYLEAAWDVLTIPELNPIECDSMRRFLNIRHSTVDSGEYEKQRPNIRLIKSANDVKDINRLYIRAFDYNDVRVKVYTKEKSKHGRVTRFEWQFQMKGRKGLKIKGKTLKKNMVRSYSEFIALINRAKSYSRKSLKPILSNIGKPNNDDVIEACCNEYFNQYHKIAYDLLTKCGCISTCENSGAHEKVKTLTRNLAKQKVFLKKDDNSARGIYVIDEDWINRSTFNKNV